MLQSIERFALLLEAVQRDVEVITETGCVSGILHLNRNEGTIQKITAQLDNAYHDFLAASTIRLEVEQSKTHLAVQRLSAETVSAVALVFL